MVIGLYGCYCHPFKNWDEHKKYNNQKIVFGAKYKVRHSGLVCIAKEVGDNDYIKIFVEPYDCERCNQIEHRSNLIKIPNCQLSLF